MEIIENNQRKVTIANKTDFTMISSKTSILVYPTSETLIMYLIFDELRKKSEQHREMGIVPVNRYLSLSLYDIKVVVD
jgi:hypothetical protein